MKIIRASHMGMCFGVRDAIDLALHHAQTSPTTVLGHLVHNPTVLDHLQSQGVRFEHHPANVTTPTVMITAHGASKRAVQNLRQQGLQVLQATCPLVHYAHKCLHKLLRAGYHPIIIGKPDHVEVKGMTEDLNHFHVVLTDKDVAQLEEFPRFGVVAQTTQPLDKVHHLLSLIRKRFPQSEVRFIDTVCQPTKQRQTAAVDLAQSSDLVIVIGGANSNNTHELATTCRRHCPKVYQVQTAQDLRSNWFDGTETIGVTAGTSTPDNNINDVVEWLENLAKFQSQLTHHLNQPT